MDGVLPRQPAHACCDELSDLELPHLPGSLDDEFQGPPQARKRDVFINVSTPVSRVENQSFSRSLQTALTSFIRRRGPHLTQDLEKRVMQHKLSRIMDRYKVYRGVMFFGQVMVAIAEVGYAVLSVASALTANPLVLQIFDWLLVPILASGSVGLLAMSSCPTENLDLDCFFSDSRFAATFFGVGLFLNGLYNASVPPYLLAYKPPVSVLFLLASFGCLQFWRSRPTWHLQMFLLPELFCVAARKIYNKMIPSQAPPCSVWAIAADLFWAVLINLVYFRNLRSKAHPTSSLYTTFYIWCASLATRYLFDFLDTVWFLQTGEAVDLVPSFFVAVGLGVPCLLVVVAGRQRVFSYLSHRLDNSQKMRIKDGAFMATLMDDHRIAVDDTWWVHSMQAGCNDQAVFIKTAVTRVTDIAFTVQGSAGLTVTIPHAHRNVSWEELVKEGFCNLRCLDWQTMTPQMFESTTAQESDLGRKVNDNEVIDFFISHSWYDDPVSKYECLCRIAEEFKAKHRRYPTFWFDKSCIDQTAISDGLRLLPVHIMQCKQLLILCGKTYARRLWCVWEICVLLSFVNVTVALEHLQCWSLSPDALDQLAMFDLSKAHCYDPNEERKLRKVIEAVGGELFVAKIRDVGKKLSKLPPALQKSM